MATEKTAPRERSANDAPKKGSTLRRKFFNLATGFDMNFFVLLMILIIVGLATLYSASYVYASHFENDSFFYIRKQAGFVLLGLAAMLGISTVDYHIFHRWAWLLWIASMGLLVAALFMPSETDIHRWVYIGPINFQPSEVAKFALVVLFAHLISLNHKKMKTFTAGFLPFIGILAVTCGLVVIEPHLSGTLLIGILGLSMMYVGGTRTWLVAGVVILGIVGVVFMVTVLGYEQDRIAVWLDPMGVFKNDRNQAWQTVQSLFAIGSGGLLGRGPGESLQKHLYLPEPQNDFVFAVFCEEMGLVGAVLVLVLFALLMWRGFKIAMKAPDKFGCMLALGLTIQIGIQVALNVAVVSNLLPNTGISLPFFSYGGTSILMLMAQMGVVLSVSRQSKMEKL